MRYRLRTVHNFHNLGVFASYVTTPAFAERDKQRRASAGSLNAHDTTPSFGINSKRSSSTKYEPSRRYDAELAALPAAFTGMT